MSKETNQDMGTGSVKKLMVQMAVPAVVGQVINLLYNVVDRIYIGHIPEIGGAAYVQTSMAENLGAFGPVFLSAAMSLFAFTTLIGNYSYCEGCLRFILNRAVSRGGILAFRSLATLLVFVGAIANAGTVWNLADMTQGLMVLVNLPVILILAKPAFLCLEDYCKQKKDGKNPVFIAKDAGIDSDLDFWK